MKAIILAAGYSTRLYPLTLNTPKPLLEVGGLTMLDRILLSIRPVESIDTVYVAINERFKESFESWHAALDSSIYDRSRIVLVNDGTTSNDNRLGPVGDITLILERCQVDDDVLVLAGDNLYELDFDAVMNLRRQHDASVLGVYDLKSLDAVRKKFGVVSVTGEGRVVKFAEKPEEPESAIAATAIYLIRREDLRCILDLQARAGGKELNAGDIIIELLACGRTVYCKTLDVWFDIGTHDDLARARERFAA